MAESKYATDSKETLIVEIKDRRTAGRKLPVDLRANEDALRAALEADDVDNGEFTEDKEISAEELSLGAAARADGVTERQVPDDLDEYSGQYRYLPTGEIFGLQIKHDLDVRAHKTHHAKSPLKFWDGTAEEFRANFDKV